MKTTLLSARYVVFLFGLSLYAHQLYAQTHVSPRNGALGVPGTTPRSFIIEWEAVPGAIGYEYVLSDNPLCFSGCPGDTRQDYVTGTSAVEYNLQEGVWYYWITRIFYSETEVTEWTNITSFLAETPEQFEQIVELAPNPATDHITVHIDWAINPAARFVTVELYNVMGQKLIGPIKFFNPFSRFSAFEIPVSTLPAGLYLGVFLLDGNPNNPNNRVVKTFMIL